MHVESTNHSPGTFAVSALAKLAISHGSREVKEHKFGGRGGAERPLPLIAYRYTITGAQRGLIQCAASAQHLQPGVAAGVQIERQFPSRFQSRKINASILLNLER